jgi:hypothetical protein
VRLVWGQESDPPRRLFQEPDRRRPIQPLPVARALAQDRSHEREHAIYGRVRTPFRLFRFGDRIDQGPIDTLEIAIGQKLVEPTQDGTVSIDRGLVGLLSEPAHRRVLPDSLRPRPEALSPPDFASQLVVQLLRLGPFAGLSRSAYSLTTGGGEVDPPDRPALLK